MTGVTAVTLANGQRYEIKGDYESVDTYLSPRKMMADDGRREVIRTDGRRVKLNIGAILTIEETAQKTKKAIGFS